MPDKRQTDNQQPTPKRPPKSPAQDYSSLPQKPIKLKTGVDLPPALKRSGEKKTSSKRAKPPVAKKKTAKKPVAKSVQPLSGLSKKARDLATTTANSEGLSVTDWVEKVIIERTQATPAEPPPDIEGIRQALELINERLWRLENRKGFWRRFWEQYVEPYQK